MLVLTVKMSAFKVVCILVALSVVVAFAVWPRGSATEIVMVNKQYTGITTNEKRIEFLQGFGWKVDSIPIEEVEITIPQTFYDVYNNYNILQKKQGYDLSKFKGQRVKRWTYRITNYPGVTDEVRADLLVYNDKIIGGDVCTVALNGFMHGFTPPDTTQKTDAGTNTTPANADITSGLFSN
jgi:hypothetical protein